MVLAWLLPRVWHVTVTISWRTTEAMRTLLRPRVQELETSGRTVVLTKGDISQSDDAGALIETALSELGQIDVLVNNAGITRDTLMMRMSEDDWDAVIDTNLKGAFLDIKGGHSTNDPPTIGRIINLTSVVGLVGNAGQANYASAKAGLVGLTEVAGQGSRLTRNHRQRCRTGFHRDSAHRRPQSGAQRYAPQADSRRSTRPTGGCRWGGGFSRLSRSVVHYRPRSDR